MRRLSTSAAALVLGAPVTVVGAAVAAIAGFTRGRDAG